MSDRGHIWFYTYDIYYRFINTFYINIYTIYYVDIYFHKGK